MINLDLVEQHLRHSLRRNPRSKSASKAFVRTQRTLELESDIKELSLIEIDVDITRI